MRHIHFTILLLALALAVAPAQAQRKKGLQGVAVTEFAKKVYQTTGLELLVQKDTTDKNLYVLSEENTFDDAIRQLKENNYFVTQYNGKWYATRKSGIVTKLPVNYLATSVAATPQSESTFTDAKLATNANKTYVIGIEGGKAAEPAVLEGKVVDAASGQPIPGISVYDDSGKAYAQTDAQGHYKISLRGGESFLNFSGYGLDDLKLHLKVNGNGTLDVAMRERTLELKGAVVTAEGKAHHRVAKMGVEKVSADALKTVPVVFGEADILKVVLALPGVKSVGEAATGFNVRGGSTDQNLILFNGGTLYNPSHMFGILSSFNADVMAEAELYKSSIPAEFGGRISSVLDIKTRDGNFEKFSGSVGIGLLTSKILLEAPLAKGSTSFILGARTTYSNWMLKLLPKNSSFSGGSADFQDVNLGLTHKFNKNHSIRAFGYWSRDKFSFSSDTTYRYNNANGSLQYKGRFNEANAMELTGTFDQYNYDIRNVFSPKESYRLENRIRQYSAKMTFRSQAGSWNKLSYGLSGVMYDNAPGKMSPFGDGSLIEERSLPTEKAIEAAVYLSDEIKAGRWLTFDLGIRYSYFKPMTPGQTKNYGGPEYRASAKVSFTDNFSWKAGFNTMRQYIHMISNSVNVSPTDIWKLSNDRIRPQEGWQAATGLYWTIGSEEPVDISLEGYYKKTQHYLDYKSGAVLVMNNNLEADLIDTENKAYGAELMIKKNTGKLNGWVSYTYSRSLLRQIPSEEGETLVNKGGWYAAPYDKPHDVKVVLNYKFTKRFSISTNFDYSTGRPVTLPVGKFSYGGDTRLQYTQRNGYRIPDYLRLDLALNIEPNHNLRQLAHLSVTIGCYNVTGRKNPYSVYYTAEKGKITGHMLSVFACQIPYVSLNLKF